MTLKDIISFAKAQGYETAEYRGEWREFKCYEPIFLEGKVAYTGLPVMILESKDGNLRMSTSEETFQFIDEMLDDE